MKPARAFSASVYKFRGQQGFSLIELLVVALIFSIVMAAVLGTVSVATRTTRTNTGISEANQNIRAVTRLLANDVNTLGEVLATPSSFAQVKAGFWAAHGFPTADVANVAGYDKMYAIQAWTLPSTNGSASVGTLSSQAVRGIIDPVIVPPALTPPLISSLYPSGLFIYPGTCGPNRVAAGPLGPSLYQTGTDQLMLTQIEPIFVNLNVPAAPGPGTTQRIFPLTNDYTATATFSGGNLVLKPNVTVVGLTGNHNFDPAALVAGSSYVNTNDSRLGNRLQPYVDCLLIVNGATQFLGLVTGVDAASGDIRLASNPNAGDFFDVIGLNPSWNAAIPGMSAVAGPSVRISRMRLTYYFLGWTGAADAINGQPPILFRREGSLISPVAFNVENFQLKFDLIDEYDQGAGAGRFWTVENLGAMPSGAPLAIPNSVPAANRDSTYAKSMVRTIQFSIYGRTSQIEPGLAKAEGTTIPDYYNRGFFHVQENFTVGLRNIAYSNTK